jgi:hypothetical protein
LIGGRKSRLLDTLVLGTVIPELHVALGVQSTLFEKLTLFCENVFECDTLVGEDLNMSAADYETDETWFTYFQVVGNQVSVLATWTCDQDCAVVVSLLGHSV